MKKIGLLVFALTLIGGIVLAGFTSFGGSVIKSPFSFVFGSKVVGSGDIGSEARSPGEFNAVKVGGIYNVEITQSAKTKVVIEADENLLPLIRTEVSDGTLRISSYKKFKTKNKVIIKIGAPNVNAIRTSGVAKVNYINVDLERFELDSSGASRITAVGKVKTLVVDMSGASSINGEGLKAFSAKIDSSGASSISVGVESSLSAKASGASSVKYSGNPSELNKSVSGAGSVSKIE